MALTHTTAARNALANQINTLANAGTTNPSARLIIATSGDVEVATLVMSNPAFGTASGGAITAGAITSDTDATGGTAAIFKIVDRNNVEVYRGTVGTSGADLNLSSLSIAPGDTVSISSVVYTASV